MWGITAVSPGVVVDPSAIPDVALCAERQSGWGEAEPFGGGGQRREVFVD
jgi:hypothetical protein